MSNRYPPKILTLPLAAETSYSENASGLYDGYNVDCTTVGAYTLTLTAPVTRGRRFINNIGTANNLTVATAGTSSLIAGAATYVMFPGDGAEAVANGVSPSSSAVWYVVANNVGETSVTPGTVTASKAVVVDANKDIATFRNLSAVNLNASTAVTTTSASAVALAVGLTGATNSAFVVDSSTGSQAAGLKVTGATAAGTVAAAVISSGAAASLTVNAKGTGTIGIGSVSTGTVTITPATIITGIVTPTGGVAAAGGFAASPRLCYVGGTPAITATQGTDSTPVNTETYIGEVFIPSNTTVTGVAILNGSAVAGNVRISLANNSGVPIAAALTASTAQAGTAVYQLIPFAVAYAALGPATYYVLVQFDTNTTPRVRTHVVGTFGASKKTGETYGTFTTVTPPTTFTTVLAPIASLY